MLIKNLFDPVVKQDIIDRINQLKPDSQRQWGKMSVSQMMAHLQMPIGVGIGKHQITRSPLMKLIGRFFKPIFINDKPFKQGLPTDRSFVIKDDKDFNTEKIKLLEMVGQFKEENISEAPHPIFGKLTKEQWSRGTWKHLDHHLRQFGV
jgi:hypothetical protein